MTISVLDGLAHKPLNDILYACRELLEDTDFPTVKLSLIHI